MKRFTFDGFEAWVYEDEICLNTDYSTLSFSPTDAFNLCTALTQWVVEAERWITDQESVREEGAAGRAPGSG